MPVARQVYNPEALSQSLAGTFFLWSQSGISTVLTEVSTALKPFKHLFNKVILFLCFQTCLQRQHLKKKYLKNSKVMKSKMGPRMHQNCTIFLKKSGEACPRTLLAWLCAFCPRMEILYVSNIVPPLHGILDPPLVPTTYVLVEK